jgi:ribonuclease HI
MITTTRTKLKNKKGTFYAVHRGKEPGVYESWASCKAQVHGFAGARYKKFDSQAMADHFALYGSSTAASTRVSCASASSTPFSSTAALYLSPAGPFSSSSSSSSGMPPRALNSIEAKMMNASKRQFSSISKGSSSAASNTGYDSSKRARKMSKKAARLQAAADVINNLPPTAIKCFTDGACIGNPGPSGAGAYFQFPDGSEAKRAKPLGHGTNNIGELTAIKMALKEVSLAKYQAEYATAPLHIFTDSQYTHGVVDKGWNAKENQELISTIKERLRKTRLTRTVEIHWVPAHSGLEGNEVADQLASGAAKTQLTSIDDD